MARYPALIVIDTQIGIFETPGVPPVPEGESPLRNIEGLIVAHHNGAMGNAFADVVPSAEISPREPVRA